MSSKAPSELLLVGDREVTVSNPGKVLFPAAGFTKLDLVRYGAPATLMPLGI